MIKTVIGQKWLNRCRRLVAIRGENPPAMTEGELVPE
jgi:hypothetical protein